MSQPLRTLRQSNGAATLIVLLPGAYMTPEDFEKAGFFSAVSRRQLALDIAAVDPRVARIMDLKAPDSAESARNRWENLALLNPRDEIKVVIASRGDYEWARDVFRPRQLDARCPVLFSPAQGRVEPADLAAWILEDGLEVRFQLQLHKLLWGNMKGK